MMNPVGASLLRLEQQSPLSQIPKSEKMIKNKALAEKQEQTAPTTAESTTEGVAEIPEDLSGIWERAMKEFEDQVFMSSIPLCVPSI